MKKITVLLFGLIYGGTLLYNAPATLLDSYVQHYSQNKLVLSNTQGTLWQGRTTLALHSDKAYYALPSLSWEFIPAALLQGRIELQLTWQEYPASTLTLTRNSLEIKPLQIDLPARVLTESSPALRPAQLQGLLQIQSPQITLTQQSVNGQITINWHNAGSPLSQINPLGNYQVLLQGQNQRVNITLSTLSGALQLNGQGHWQLGQTVQFNGTAQAAAGSEDKLKELLINLGPESSPGVRSFRVM